MPSCGCTQICNCTVAEDGFWGNHPELGRNFSLVTGSGDSSDPFVITFLDQLDFRPRTAEIGFNNFALSSTGALNYISVGVATSSSGFLVYESPINFVINDGLTANRYLGFNYVYMGASVTFAEAADASTNDRQIILTNVSGTVGPTATNNIIAGSQSPGGNADPLTLTCEVYWPGIFFDILGVGGIRHEFQLWVHQNSGGPINLTDIKIWVTEI